MEIVAQVREKLSSKIITFFEKNSRRYYIDISSADILDAVKIMFCDLQCRFVIATGIDTPQGLEILYHFSYDKTGEMFTLRVLIPDKTNPE
ncbi:MAG: hypothetical protein QME68_03420, partial [Elusimicrobiota bacterium]|nr:hypothetical protein [Elusimicrobiota bacterium]